MTNSFAGRSISASFFVSGLASLLYLGTPSAVSAGIPEGEELLRHGLYADVPLLPFKKSKIAELSRVWPRADRKALEWSLEIDPYRTTLDYYGFRRTEYDNAGFPLGLTPVGRDRAFVNCMMCHTGEINGKFVVGLGDTRSNFALFAKDYIKLTSGLPDSALRSTLVRYVYVDEPTDGVNYAGGFALLGLSIRDEDMGLHSGSVLRRPLKDFQHLVSDAPAWWNLKYKEVTTVTGILKHTPKSMMQFFMATSLEPSAYRAMLPTVEKFFDYVQTLEAPPYPGAVDLLRARTGRAVFERDCASCHGRKLDDGKYAYAQTFVPLGVVKTDAARSRADEVAADLNVAYNRSWMTDYGATAVERVPETYIPPPLVGIWATAPYLHNGSVPTLRAMFYPEERPVIWRRTGEYDVENPGLRYREIGAAEYGALSWREQRRVYDTRRYSQGREGHPFTARLAEDEKRDVLEYLKTF